MVLLCSCASGVREDTAHVLTREVRNDDLATKIQRLASWKRLNVRGTIVIQTPSGKREGEYELTISGDDMTMEISAKGIKAGEVIIRDNNASISPSLEDEFMTHMFAVIIRDSISWWNITGYELLDFKDVHVLRNSWRKIYIRPGDLTPVRQIFKLMKFRTVEVMYGDGRQFNNEMLPALLRFNYMKYSCEMNIETVRF